MNFGSAVWLKSSFSDHNGSCVEVALLGTAVGIRDSKDTGWPHLTVGSAGWAAFIESLRSRRCHPN
ncbi:DUF397 domain-containing protein [Actinophytocola sp.]|uniref:DUF397 domain-containing protein n=1 Tax=Actinophytocola sp. TaxID=1872138 RepID=UPI00389A14C6